MKMNPSVQNPIIQNLYKNFFYQNKKPAKAGF